MTTPTIRTTLAALATVALLLTTATATAQARYTYSAAGDEVTDTQTGLTWRRCSEGQAWSGSTCTGIPATYTHESALVQAKTQTGWRLPNVKELASLADKTRTNPAIDTTAFPTTPLNGYWSATPYTDSPGTGSAWVVNFSNGSVGYSSRSSSGNVRLVR